MNNKQFYTLVVIGGVAAYLLKEGIGNAVVRAGDAVNPVNPDNIFYGGVNAVGGALSGDDNFSLGSWIFDKVNGDGYAG